MNLLGNLPFNWFDILIVIVLVAGAFRGRKRGMSQELIPVLKWIAILLVSGLLYAPLADLITGGTVFTRLSSAIAAYLGLAVVVALVFALINRQLGGKIVGSDAFGGAEYYLGIVAGMIRFACILLFGLSLLNARQYTSAEINAHNQFVKQNFDHDFFPPLFQLQDQVFKYSLAGPVIANNLTPLLIKPTPAEQKGLKRKELDLPF
jgi:uncharacterized membrane protein required for colicin V production